MKATVSTAFYIRPGWWTKYVNQMGLWLGLNADCIYPADHSATLIIPMVSSFWWRSWAFLSSTSSSSSVTKSIVIHLTSRAKNESWSECSDHISAAADSSNFVAGTPIHWMAVITRWKMLSQVSWNCHIFTRGGPNWLLLSQSSSSWNCHILTWGGPEWLLSHGEKLDGTKFHRLQSQNEGENTEILLDNLVLMYLLYSLNVLHMF